MAALLIVSVAQHLPVLTVNVSILVGQTTLVLLQPFARLQTTGLSVNAHQDSLETLSEIVLRVSILSIC